jgi:hypothetical protein
VQLGLHSLSRLHGAVLKAQGSFMLVAKLSLLSTTRYVMRTYGRGGEWICRSMFSGPRYEMEVSGQVHATATLTPYEGALGAHWIRCWVGSTTDLDDMEK